MSIPKANSRKLLKLCFIALSGKKKAVFGIVFESKVLVHH